MSTKELKNKACESLRGKWLMAIVVGFIATIFIGGMSESSGIELEVEPLSSQLAGAPNRHAVTLTILGMRFGVTLDTVQNQWLISILLFLLGVMFIFSIIRLIVSCVIGGCIEVGYSSYHLKLYDGDDASVKDLFSSFGRFADCLALYWLKFLYVFLWSLLFIVPGIIAGYKYAMAAYILRDNPNMTASEAITASKEMMQGHKMELFLLELSFIGWILLGILTLGIGLYVLEPYMMAAKTAFYRKLIDDANAYKREYSTSADYNQNILENIV